MRFLATGLHVVAVFAVTAVFVADLDDVDATTLREWILDGMPRRVRPDPSAERLSRHRRYG